MSPPRLPSSCKSCGAAILWLRGQVSGPQRRPMPVDPRPVPDGNLFLFGVRGADGQTVFESYRVLAGEALAQYRENGTPLYQSHFRSCPQAPEHRQPRPTATQPELL